MYNKIQDPEMSPVPSRTELLISASGYNWTRQVTNVHTKKINPYCNSLAPPGTYSTFCVLHPMFTLAGDEETDGYSLSLCDTELWFKTRDVTNKNNAWKEVAASADASCEYT